MRPEGTVEYNSLSWVKKQLDTVLGEAQAVLSEYIENHDAASLERCIDHLRLVFGTLQMVEVYGAAMLAEEMELTAQALLESRVEKPDDAFDVLMRAMLQLPDYLEGLQAGSKDMPIVLMPLMNDLRAARKEKLLSESVLFLPDVDAVTIESSEPEISVEAGKLADEARRLRTHYQLGLLDLLRNNKAVAGLRRMSAVIKSLEKASANKSVRQFWTVVSSLLESLLDKGIDNSISVNLLLGAVDRQIKYLIDNGEEEFATGYSRETLKNILYYVGQSSSTDVRVARVKQAYRLDELLPAESDVSGIGASMTGFNAELFDTVSQGIREDLAGVKDILEIFMHSSEKDVQQLVPLVKQLEKIADTYGMLGLGAVRQKVADQRVEIEKIISGEIEAGEHEVMEIAGALLGAEAELDNYIAAKSGLSDSDIGGEDRIVPASEYRKVLATVVGEALNNFTEAKDAILSYAAGIGGQEQLEIIQQRLEEVRGAAMMLPMTRIEQLINRLMKYVRVAFMQHERKPELDEQDSIADVVTSVEYYLEAVAEGRPGVDIGLDTGEAAVERLMESIRQYEGTDTIVSLAGEQDTEADEPKDQAAVEEVEQMATGEPVENVPVAEEAVELEEVTAQEHGEQESALASAHLEHVSEQQQEEYEILGEDADDEIVEIFIEEGVEVLEALHEHLPKWKANKDDEESLTVVRRSFHTLKGSGRLIGAMLIGEFAWKIENILNRVIEHRIEVTDELFTLLDEAMSVLPQLIEQLKGNREPIPHIYQLMSAADALSEGKRPEIVIEEDASDAVGVIEEAVVEDAGQADEPAETEAVEEIQIDVSGADADEVSAGEVISLDAGDDGVSVDFESEGDDTGQELEEISLTDDDEIVSLDVSDDSAAELDEFDLSIEEPEEDLIEISELEISADGPEPEEEVSGPSANESLADEMDYEEPESEDNQDIVDLSADDELLIEIDEAGTFDKAEDAGISRLEMDPMLLQIYYDESRGHVKTVRDLLAMHESGEQKLEANKDLIRAFHTLFGSARTAGVESIAEISGTTEKYVKAREEAEDISIPQAAIETIGAVVECVDAMLEDVKSGRVPGPDKELHERVTRLVQHELQEQLQQSSSSSDDATRSAAPQPSESSVDEKADEVETEITYGDVDDDLIDIFLEEAEELLEDCETSLSKLEDDVDDSDSVLALQRHMHTLKGGARMASLTPVGDITHVLESMVIAVAEQKIEADKSFFSVVHESLDTLNAMLENVKQRKPLVTASQLVSKIKQVISGEVPEKRAIERFDVEMEELKAPQKKAADSDAGKPAGETEETRSEAEITTTPRRRAVDEADERPHWGERATDVNYKESQEQVRVRADLLNNLVNYAGEVNIHHARMGKQITDIGFNLKELNQTVIRLREQLRKLEIETEIQIRSSYEKEEDFDENFDPLEMDRYSTLQQLTRSLAETASDVESIKNFLAEIVSDSETLLMQESRISTDLQEGLMRTRMVRFGGMSTRLRRIVRQTARELGKEVNVEIIGEENEVDRTVLDRIVAPLEHMLRNAVAHGIESPQERTAAGKPEAGTIRILVGRQGPDVVLNVSDDGSGINTDAIRSKAIKQGLLEENSPLTDHDVLQFILKSGFSTAAEVTQISGRGVGLDVVDSEIKQLGGLLEIDTEKGRGTTFKIRLPLTLAINQALLVSAGEDVYAVPLASIEGVVRITGVELQGFYDSGDLHYEFNGVNYELKHLGKLLTGNQADYSSQVQLFPVLLAKVGDQHFALHVDDLLGRREIVVKPVGLQIGTVRGIAGATILADGRVVLILEMSALVVGESLFKQVVTDEVVEAPKAAEEPTIMVVDDSITIRKVTTRILERNGMKVMSATDGVDATNQLQDATPDLMLLDIEMPRMDGFELASYMRNDERLKQIPIIMITSRTGAKHKERAMEIGVDEYLGKPYQEEELMKNINALLKVYQ